MTDATQQLIALVQQQQLLLQQVMSNQGERKKKDPPVYEGKFSEDLELWIFLLRNTIAIAGTSW
jgi:hypothetical protein